MLKRAVSWGEERYDRGRSLTRCLEVRTGEYVIIHRGYLPVIDLDDDARNRAAQFGKPKLGRISLSDDVLGEVQASAQRFLDCADKMRKREDVDPPGAMAVVQARLRVCNGKLRSKQPSAERMPSCQNPRNGSAAWISG
jgi:hypothetical protein